MWPMDISTRLDFAAEPDDVFAMMTDQAYLEEVCVASESISYDASVSGSTTTTSRTLAAPESAARFTGAELTVNEEVAWGGAGAGGARTADLTMTVLGQPVTLKGRLRARARWPRHRRRSHRRAEGRDPLSGQKLEQAAAPAVLAGFRTQQRVGDDWLTR